jgi:hypothetical protein
MKKNIVTLIIRALSLVCIVMLAGGTTAAHQLVHLHTEFEELSDTCCNDIPQHSQCAHFHQEHHEHSGCSEQHCTSTLCAPLSVSVSSIKVVSDCGITPPAFQYYMSIVK